MRLPKILRSLCGRICPLALALLLPLSGCRETRPDSTEAAAGSEADSQSKTELPAFRTPGNFPSSEVTTGIEKESLSLLIWEEYLVPDVVAKFEAEFGARLKVTEVENSERLKQALASRPTDYDVVVADELTMRELISLRLIRELDAGETTVKLAKTNTLLASPLDPGNQYTVPYLWGLTVLAGRAEVLRDVTPSWSLIWREDLRVAVLDEPYDLVWLGLLALGYDPSMATKVQIDEATSRIEKRFPDLTDHMLDLISGLDALEAGELDLLITYNGDALSRASGNPSITVVLPNEGGPIWVDSFAVSRDAPNPGLAYRFIEFMSRPEISAETANSLNYASPNPNALASLDPSLRANPVLYPEESVMKKCRFVNFPVEVVKHVNQSIFRIISGGRIRGVAAEAERIQAAELVISED